MTKTEQKLNEVFNVDTPSIEVHNDIIPSSDYQDEELGGELVDIDDSSELYKKEDDEIKRDTQSDYDVARDSLHDALNISKDLLDLAVRVAESSENPKCIESATKALSQYTDISIKLMDINAKKQDVIQKTRPKMLGKLLANADLSNSPVNNITNNTLFVGSTAELSKALREMNKQESENDQYEEITITNS